jgi:hypothetical protein
MRLGALIVLQEILRGLIELYFVDELMLHAQKDMAETLRS